MSNIAVIGAGRIGRIHAANVSAHPHLRLKAIVDPDLSASLALAAQFDATACDFDSVINDTSIDGVIIASPTDRHLAQSAAALISGKAVLCEKPIDMSLARALEMENVLGRGKPLMLGFNRRFDRHFATVKRQIEAGRIGALETLLIISHDPAPPPIDYVKISGGLFKDMAIHDFDMARYLLGEDPVEVYATGACLVDPNIGECGDIDTARTVLKTATGKLCVISNSRRSGYGYDQRIEAYGSNGLLKADNVVESTVSHWGSHGAQADAFQNFFLDRYAEAYRAEIEHFAAIIANKTPPLVGFADGIQALAIAEAAQKSLSTGKPVLLQSYAL